MSLRQLQNQQGFTLIELMIVVGVVALLAAIALPSYNQYVQRTRRSEGQSALMNAQQAEEKFFFRCNRYGSMQEIYGNSAPTCGAPPAAGTSIESSQKYYVIALAAITATTYNLNAAPENVQATDPCMVLSLDNTGTKGATGDPLLGTDGDVKRCWH
jgi:type IV pilus assembly protein PilE